MCGIAGSFGTKLVKKSDIIQTLDLMKNRGPDFSDYYENKFKSNQVYLLHSRLSIIDLNKRSNQPFKINNYIISFNGEIYNYKELKKILFDKKIKLKTNSDTEVLLWLFIIYGEKCLDLLEGMWSFAIYNNKSNELFLARDRFGEKPLYYSYIDQEFIFGSEVKFIKSLSKKNYKINYDKINDLLLYGYKSLKKNDKSFFDNIKSLPASHYIKISSKKFVIKRYWKINTKINYKININEALEETKRLLFNSIELRLKSDVPISFCLSGGVDSSILTSYATKKLGLKINTYSVIDSDQRYDESSNIRKIVNDLNCNNTMIKLDNKNFLPNLVSVIEYHEAPMASIAQYLHWNLMKKISDDNFKVAISGAAADEIFSGYYEHFLLHFHHIKKDKKKYKSDVLAWKKNIRPHIRNKFFRNENLYINNPNFRDHIFDGYENNASLLKNIKLKKFREVNFSQSLYLNRRLNELNNETTPIILENEDKSAMMNSVENRSPYLDSSLVNFIFSLNPSYNIQKDVTKYLLKNSAKEFVHKDILFDKKKKGFNSSIDTLLDFNDDYVKDFILSKSKISEFIDQEKLEILLKKKKKPNYLSKFLFNVINCKMFLDLNS
jgi:asparagine synthase (glutamine-hydrolysing)